MKQDLGTLKTTRLDFGDAEVVFAVLPFSELGPALDASTLATILRRLGVRAKVVYFNRVFAKDLSRNFYENASAPDSLNSLLGDWIFRHAAFGATDDRAYFRNLIERGLISAPQIPPALHAQKAVNPFLDVCLSEPDWSAVKVLCLVETFSKRNAVSGQLMASLAFAKKVKARLPNLQVVLASPGAEREMGQALTELPYLDFVCPGDVYDFIPRVVTKMLEKSSAGEAKVGHEKLVASNSRHLKVLDLPIPDFDDYFELNGDGLPGSFDRIPIQGSTGCWWADHNHCTFCALPGATGGFRSKAPDSFFAEFVTQWERYSPRTIELHDLIIEQSYFNDVIPRIASLNHDTSIFLQTKAHLNADKIAILSKAGVRGLQAGIETLSPTTLTRISKGLSVRKNIEFLAACKNAGIFCYWNYLHSFPGETAADILQAIPVIASAQNAEPPSFIQPVRVERFSPYFKNPALYGIEHIWPDRSYAFIYGEAGIDLSRLAFYHEHRELGHAALERTSALRELRLALEDWRSRSYRS
ncbi:RiPP maturation radical SAM C-methyltransferase [Rhizobium ruizarguesonis]